MNGIKVRCSSSFVVKLNSISLPDGFRISDAPRVLSMLREHSPGRDPDPPVAPKSEDEAVVLPTAMDPRRHHVARRGAAEIEVDLRHPFADDIAVGHHAD